MLRKKKQHELGSKLQVLEKSLSSDNNTKKCHKCEADLDGISDNTAEGVKIRDSGTKKAKIQQNIS